MSIAIRHRQPNGDLRRPTKTQREREAMSVAMGQPHRAGSRMPEHEWRCELFGRLILDRGWGFDDRGRRLAYGPSELWDAGNRFKREYHSWQRAKASKRAWENETRPAPRSVDEMTAIRHANEAIARYARTVEIFAAQQSRVYEAAVNVILTDQAEDWTPGYGVVESAYDALVALAEWYGGQR